MTLKCITKILLLLWLQNDSLLSSALFMYVSGWHSLLSASFASDTNSSDSPFLSDFPIMHMSEKKEAHLMLFMKISIIQVFSSCSLRSGCYQPSWGECRDHVSWKCWEGNKVTTIQSKTKTWRLWAWCIFLVSLRKVRYFLLAFQALEYITGKEGEPWILELMSEWCF